MQLERRIAALERASFAVRSRPAGMPLSDFVASMVAAIRDLPVHAMIDVAKPWLRAMSHAELRELVEAIDEQRQRRAQGGHA